MNRVLQLPLGASAPPVMESYTLGDVLICKANRGKQLEVEHLVKTLHADVNYRNQARRQSVGRTALKGEGAR